VFPSVLPASLACPWRYCNSFGRANQLPDTDGGILPFIAKLREFSEKEPETYYDFKMRPWFLFSELERAYGNSPAVAARDYLAAKHQWPEGLLALFESSLATVAKRFVICDDSTFMNASNGTRIVEQTHTNTSG
jgi:hypothetical protein